MTRVVSTPDLYELQTIIQDQDLNTGDIVNFEPENQMGARTYVVAENAAGVKSLRLIWDAEFGDVENVHYSASVEYGRWSS